MSSIRPRDTLTVCTIARNEEQRLPAALASVREIADEIIVVDSGSSDRTVALAEQAGARVIEHPWEGFARQRNVALDAATGDWVLELDADERVTPALAAEIAAFLALPPPTAINIGVMPMRHRFLGRALGPAGRYPFYRNRLVRRGSQRHEERPVHEGLWVHEPPWVFSADLEHELAGDLNEAVRDMRAYSELSSSTVASVSGRALAIGVLVRPLVKFTYAAVVLGGARDGVPGLTRLALESAGDASTWLHARRRGPDGAGGPRAGHFGHLTPPGRLDHVLAVGDPDGHWPWLKARADHGALVSVVCAQGQAETSLAGDTRLRVRTAPGRGLPALLRAMDAEAQVGPVSAKVALDRRGAIALRLARGIRGTRVQPE